MADLTLLAPASVARPLRPWRPLIIRLRLWRRRRTRRRFIAKLPADCILADIGLERVSPTILERYAIAVVRLPR